MTYQVFKITVLLQAWQTIMHGYSPNALTTLVMDGINRVTDIANDVLALSITFMGLAELLLGVTLLFTSSSNIFNSISNIYKDHWTQRQSWNAYTILDGSLEEMKHMELYGMYAEDTSAPRRSTRLTPPTPVPNVDKADERILQDTFQRYSSAEHKIQGSRKQEKLFGNWLNGTWHLKKFEKLVARQVDVVVDCLIQAQSQTSSVPNQQYQLHLAMKADPQLQQQDIAIWLALQMKFEINTVPQTEMTSEYNAYVTGEESSLDSFSRGKAPSTSVSQDIMEEVSLTIDEAKLRKSDEDVKLRCTSGDRISCKEFLHKETEEPGKQRDGLFKLKGLFKSKDITGNWVMNTSLSQRLSQEELINFQLRIESYQKKVNLTTPSMTFPGIEDHEMFSIIYEPVHGIIYKNSKKEKTGDEDIQRSLVLK
ncbi:hypothetical protein Tco_0725367 [Tanacetum coccineum]|uniref:Uncharacterized protein n=1 Tax=Tanacetum coccineum TaxID=301880 RepID=A0ABQ4YDK2_9ASTR